MSNRDLDGDASALLNRFAGWLMGIPNENNISLPKSSPLSLWNGLRCVGGVMDGLAVLVVRVRARCVGHACAGVLMINSEVHRVRREWSEQRVYGRMGGWADEEKR
jgi:hypothetical protein